MFIKASEGKLDIFNKISKCIDLNSQTVCNLTSLL